MDWTGLDGDDGYDRTDGEDDMTFGHDAMLTLMTLRSFGMVTAMVALVIYALYTHLSLKKQR
jgi:hypothetical protein